MENLNIGLKSELPEPSKNLKLEENGNGNENENGNETHSDILFLNENNNKEANILSDEPKDFLSKYVFYLKDLFI